MLPCVLSYGLIHCPRIYFLKDLWRKVTLLGTFVTVLSAFWSCSFIELGVIFNFPVITLGLLPPV